MNVKNWLKSSSVPGSSEVVSLFNFASPTKSVSSASQVQAQPKYARGRRGAKRVKSTNLAERRLNLAVADLKRDVKASRLQQNAQVSEADAVAGCLHGFPDAQRLMRYLVTHHKTEPLLLEYITELGAMTQKRQKIPVDFINKLFFIGELLAPGASGRESSDRENREEQEYVNTIEQKLFAAISKLTSQTMRELRNNGLYDRTTIQVIVGLLLLLDINESDCMSKDSYLKFMLYPEVCLDEVRAFPGKVRSDKIRVKTMKTVERYLGKLGDIETQGTVMFIYLFLKYAVEFFFAFRRAGEEVMTSGVMQNSSLDQSFQRAIHRIKHGNLGNHRRTLSPVSQYIKLRQVADDASSSPRSTEKRSYQQYSPKNPANRSTTSTSTTRKKRTRPVRSNSVRKPRQKSPLGSISNSSIFGDADPIVAMIDLQKHAPKPQPAPQQPVLTEAQNSPVAAANVQPNGAFPDEPAYKILQRHITAVQELQRLTSKLTNNELLEKIVWENKRFADEIGDLFSS